MSWHERAACAGRTDLDWFPERVARGIVPATLAAICASCPVRDKCLDDALEESIQFGIRAGLSARQRRAIRQQRAGGKRVVRIRAEHGTDSGYRVHIQRKEKACDACRAAHTLANQERRERARARRVAA